MAALGYSYLSVPLPAWGNGGVYLSASSSSSCSCSARAASTFFPGCGQLTDTEDFNSYQGTAHGPPVAGESGLAPRPHGASDVQVNPPWHVWGGTRCRAGRALAPSPAGPPAPCQAALPPSTGNKRTNKQTQNLYKNRRLAVFGLWAVVF